MVVFLGKSFQWVGIPRLTSPGADLGGGVYVGSINLAQHNIDRPTQFASPPLHIENSWINPCIIKSHA